MNDIGRRDALPMCEDAVHVPLQWPGENQARKPEDSILEVMASVEIALQLAKTPWFLPSMPTATRLPSTGTAFRRLLHPAR